MHAVSSMTLTVNQKISYSIARFGTSIAINMTDLLTGFMYYAFFGLSKSPFLAFLGVAIGKLFIAFSSYFGGYFSDSTKSRWGRRKPWIFIGAPIMALSYFFLFTPHIWLAGVTNEYIIFGWLLVFNTLFQTLYGVVLTPYQSWLPEIASESEWLDVSGYQNVVNILAFTLGAGTAFLIPALITSRPDKTINFAAKMKFLPLSNGLFLTIVVTLFTLCIVIFFIPCLRLSIQEEFKPNPNIIDELRVVLKNKNFLGWVLSRGVFTITLSGLIGIVLAWATDVLDFGTFNYIIIGLILLVSVFVFINYWVRFGNKYGKTKTYIYAIGSLIFILPLISFIGEVNLVLSPTILGFIFGFLIAIGLAGYYVLPYAIVADIIKADQIDTGDTSRAGLYYGFEALTLNFFQFIGYLLLGILLSLPKITNYLGTKFSEGYPIFGVLSSFFVIISVFIFIKYVNADPSKTDLEHLKEKSAWND